MRDDEIARISLIVRWRKYGTFSLNKACKVPKFFLGKKESNEEEENESSFLGSSEEEEGEKGSDLMAIKKKLDPYFLLKIDLMLISFSPEISFFLWRTNLLWCKLLLSFKWKMHRKLTKWWSFEKMRVFLDRKVFIFRRIVLKKKWRWSWESYYLFN